MRTGGRLLAVTAAAAILTVILGAHVAAQSSAAPGFNVADGMPGTPPDVGLICVWAIHASIAEIGRRCGVTPNPALLAETERAVARMEAYARTRSPEGAAYMERYKQANIIGDQQLCSSDFVEAMRRESHDSDAEIARAHREIDELLARSPPVEWGNTCV